MYDHPNLFVKAQARWQKHLSTSAAWQRARHLALARALVETQNTARAHTCKSTQGRGMAHERLVRLEKEWLLERMMQDVLQGGACLVEQHWSLISLLRMLCEKASILVGTTQYDLLPNRTCFWHNVAGLITDNLLCSIIN